MRMRRLMLTGVVVGVAVASAVAAAATGPSERACLLAWNSPTNATNHSRVAAGGPWSTASLRVGAIYTLKRGSSPARTATEACLLALASSGRVQVVTGVWYGVGVKRWSFGRTIKADKTPGGSNVKVLEDGRVTKIYRR